MPDPIYAIGDIHGQIEMLEHTLDKIERDGGKDAKIVFLGDYVDRGANSKDVIDLLDKGMKSGKNWHCILGNHDRMFAMFMEDYPRTDYRLKPGYDWFHERIGGAETLASYGVDADTDRRIFQLHEDALNAVPQHHLDFINSLPLTITEGDLLFVHAGIRPGVALEQQKEDDLVWIREGFLDDPRPHDWLIVHGHTTVPAAAHYGNRVNLDTGAGYGKPLTAAVFEGAAACWVLTDEGRKPLK
ncbi:metallophosphoesterase family protein [Maritalea mediterranea]|uniref:Serine/threonine protein phosphatase n=1 Tax=Maritalea mediterranea TaxID=2909667 RepID=A0ABS9E5E9_9HYPH|nr:metallophosphoesterase family protein [Maritalea mediterranea]MCF4097020.1 serine/threonine protein phosphatase [Maritalea mediterranea]